MRPAASRVAAHTHARLHGDDAEIIEKFGDYLGITHARGSIGYMKEQACNCTCGN